MDFEKNYPIKILSKQLNLKNFSTCSYSADIFPWFVTGLIDAEGSFSIINDKNINRTLGWRIQPKFQLGLHMCDISLLLQLQQFWGGIGSIHKNTNRNMVNLSVDSIKDLTLIIKHFEKYPLLTQKAEDFFLFKQVITIIKNKAHLSIEGLHQIINIKASINRGLSNMLKSEFKNFTPVERFIIKTENIPDPYWLTGFVNGDGCFDVNITQSTNKIGYRVQLRFRITQHNRDINLMKLLKKYLRSGIIYKYPNQSAVSLTIYNISDINNIIIPFFNKNTLFGVKLLDYLDWLEIVKLVNDGSHLTIEGLNLIRKLKDGMNTGRKFNNI